VGRPMGQAFGGFPASGVSKPGAATSDPDLACTDGEYLKMLAWNQARLRRELTHRSPY
jgi:hypothetical protein